MLAASYSASCQQAVKISGTAPSCEHNDQIYCVNEYMMHTCIIRQKPSTNTRTHIQAHIKRNTQTGSQTLSTNLRVSHVKLLFFTIACVTDCASATVCVCMRHDKTLSGNTSEIASSYFFLCFYFLSACSKEVCLPKTNATSPPTYLPKLGWITPADRKTSNLGYQVGNTHSLDVRYALRNR